MDINMKRKNICVIGLGKRSFDAFIPSIIQNPDWKLMSVCEIDDGRVELFNKTFQLNDVEIFKTVGDMISNNKKRLLIDVAIVAVPHNYHFDITKQLIKNGINVLKEKPFGVCFKDSCRLHQLATVKRQQPAKLCCAMQRRFSRYYQHCKVAICKLGKIKFVNAKKSLGLDDLAGDWRKSHSQSGGGALIDVGVHILDLLITLFGEPKTINSNLIYQNYNTEDCAQMLFTWSDHDSTEFSGLLEIAIISLSKQETIEITGTNGYMIFTNKEAKVYDINRNLIHFFTNDETELQIVTRMIDEFIESTECILKDDARILKFNKFLNQDLTIMKTINNIYARTKLQNCFIIFHKFTLAIAIMIGLMLFVCSLFI